MASVEERFSLRDHLFNQTKVEQIASEITAVYPAFKAKVFISEVVVGFPERELMERLYWVRQCLKKYLPADYKEAVYILLASLPPPNDPSLNDDDFGEFIYGPYGNFVSEYGATIEYVAFSLQALREMTKRFSVEFPIRVFINAFPQETLQACREWVKDSNYHVRRLVSEGTRPKLPWAKNISLEYTVPIEFLNELYADQTRYVTRSVANHLNDIAKKDPELALETLKRWQKEGKQTNKELAFITRHSLRTLVKSGHQKALQLLGYGPAAVIVSKLQLYRNSVRLGSQVIFEFYVQSQSTQTQLLLIDYLLYFRKADGTLSPKTYKIKQITLGPNEKITIEKSHRLKPMTTKKLYLGAHTLQLQINGKRYDKVPFDLVE